MRSLVLSAASRPPDVLRALVEPGPLRLVLDAAPAGLPREDLLRAVAASPGPVVAHLPHSVGTPLVEVAFLADEATWEAGALLDVSEALLTPLLLRLGPREALGVLLAQGTLLEPAGVLALHRGAEGRSASAVALAAELVTRGRGLGPGPRMARELAAFRLALTMPDRLEGVAAFREKRSPSFDW
ncbi:MAG: hypothetical protein EDX89_22360 [Acidobacteria bacterium]|nr:MAG: hypothetical protein EDX89_22360 [Acidobacteriota bacterium]